MRGYRVRRKAVRLGMILPLLLAVFVLPERIAAFEWPTEEQRVVSTFGELRAGDYFKGIEIAGEEQEVRPVLPGEVIFFRRGGAGRRGGNTLPAGLGATVVVQHERGIRTLYGYLRDMQLDAFADGVVDGETLLGYTGGDGRAEVDGLYFQVIDGEFKRIVNPLLSLASVRDGTKPRIRGLYVRTGDELLQIRNGMTLPQGEFEVLVESFDVSGAVEALHQMCPHSIRLIVNGEEVAGLEFDAIEVQEMRHVMVGGQNRRAEEVYGSRWQFKLGRLAFRPKEMQLEIVVSDFGGNEAVQRYRVRVRE
jgi:hypothetical protein